MNQPLTERNIEILTLLAAGMEDLEMAKMLYLSPKTVKSHVAEVRRKFDARNRTHVVALAYQAGVLR